MKKILILFYLMITLTQLFSQNSCSSPLYFSPDTAMINNLNVDIPNPNFSMSYDCFGAFPDTGVTWVYFQICSSGNLDLALTPVNSVAEIDFLVYGPVTTPFSCDYTPNDVAICSYLYNVGIEVFSIGNCLAGEVYLIAISNYFNVIDQYRFERTGGTATICPIAYQSIQQPIKNTLKLYPNPSKNIVTVDYLPENVKLDYSIYGIDGRKVMEGVLNSNTIDISKLKEGAYTVIFSNENQNSFRNKILKI